MSDQSDTSAALQARLEQLEAASTRSGKVQAALYKVAEAASASTDMTEFYGALHAAVGELMYARNFFIAVLDEPSEMISWPYHVDEKDFGQGAWKPESFQDDRGVTSYVLRTGRSVHGATEYNSLIDTGEIVVRGTRSEDAAFVPLKDGPRILGALAVQSYTPGIGYTEDDVQVLTFVAQHIATALTRARAIEETRQRNAELAIINSVGEAMARTLDVKTMTRIVGDKVLEIFGCDTVSIVLLDARTNLIHNLYTYDNGEGGYVDYLEPFPLGKGLTTQVINSRQALRLDTLAEQDARGAYTSPEAIAQSSGVIAESWLGVPIMVGETVLGAVRIGNYAMHAFNEGHERLLQTLSTNMGVAIENARRFEAEQQRVAELQIINSIQQGLASKLDLQGVIDLVGDKLREVLKTDEVGIRLYDEATDLTHFPYEFEHGKRLSVEPHAPTGEFRAMQRERKPIFGATAEICRRYDMPTLPGTDVSKSIVSVPILSGEDVIGYIMVEDYERENAFNESNTRLLETIAGSMGVALENARLFDETQRLLKETDQRAAELQIINSVQEGLASKLDMQAIYDLVGEKIRDIFRTEVVYIAVQRDEAAGMIDFPYYLDRGSRIAAEPVPFGQGITSRVVQVRQPIVASTTAEQLSLGGIYADGEQSQSYLGVPIFVGDRVLGVASVQSYQPNAFDQSDARLLSTLASSMGAALQNARLFDETQRLLKETEQRNAELAIINSVQEGLASKLEFGSIIDLVGDKVGETFKSDTTYVFLYDRGTKVIRRPYYMERGHRHQLEPLLLGQGLTSIVIESRQPLLLGTSKEADAQQAPGSDIESPDEEKDLNETYLGVPIIAGGEVVGVVSVQSYQQNAYTQSDVGLLQTLSNAMSVALENARLFDETQRLLKETEQRAAELAIINSIQQALAAKLDIHGIYDAVGDRISQIFPRADVGLRIYDPETGLVHFPYAIERGKRLEISPTPLSAGIARQVFQTRAPLMINKDLAATAAKLGSSTLPGTDTEKSGLWVPILVGNEARGLVELLDMDRENAFSEGDVRLLTTITNSLSVALENARLFDETQRLLKETEQRAAELAIINSVQEGLASKMEIQSIYDLVGEKIRETFGADTASISVYYPQQREFRIPYYVDQGEHLQPRNVPLGKGLTSIVFETRRHLLLKSSEEHKDAALHTAYADPSKDRNESYLGVPILVGEAVTGVLSVQSHRKSAYDDAHAQLLSTLASSMSVALENARLFDETQRLLKETEQRAAELAIINSVQVGLASKMEMQSIYDLVGEQLRETFSADAAYIAVLDETHKLFEFPYYMDSGQRLSSPALPVGRGLTSEVLTSRAPLMLNSKAEMGQHDSVTDAYEDATKDLNQSFLGVPVLLRDRVSGVVSVQSHKANAYAENDLHLLQTLANSMSVALESARLFDETQRLLKETDQRAAELQIINSVQEGLASKLDIQAIFDLVGDKVLEIFKVDVVSIVSFDADTGNLIDRYSWEKGDRTLTAGLIPVFGFRKHVAETRQSILVNRDVLGVSARYDNPVLYGASAKSCVFVPMLVGNRVTGVVSLQDLDREDAFSESQVRLLETLASSMSVALENARLFDEVQTRNQEVSEALEQQTATGDILSVIAANPTDVQPVLDAVAEKAARLCGSYDAAVMRIDGDRFRVAAHWGPVPMPEREMADGSPLDTGTVTGRALLEGRLLHVHDVMATPDGEYTRSKEYHSTSLQRTLLVAPLMREGAVIGGIVLRRQEVAPFTDKQITLLRTFADQAAIAIENVRLFNETARLLKETEQRAAELASINTVSQGLVAEADLAKMIQLVGDELLEIFDPDIAYVALLDPESNMLDFPYQHGDEMPRMPAGQGLTGRIMETGAPLLINRDIARRRQELGTRLVGKQATSFLGVPIMAGGEVIGAISVQSTRIENAFSEDDSRLLSTIAANTGAAIQTARLHTETRRRGQEMATLAEIGNDIAGTRELEPVLERIAEHALSIMHVRDIAITLREEDGGDFHTRVALGRYSDEMRQLVVRPGLGIMGIILMSGKAEFANDPQNDPRRVTVPGTPEVEEEPECLMGAPLISRGEVIGGLMVWRLRKEGVFTQAELDFLVSVARQTTIAIESARLYLETQRRANEMSALADVGREISASLDKGAVLELIAGRAMDLLAAENSAVFLMEPDGRSMRAIAARGNAAEALRSEVILLGEGIIGHLAAEGRAEFVNDVFHDPRGIEVPGMNESETERLMVAPLMRGDEVVGMLAVWRTTAAFSQADLNFLIGLARQAAIALENARLFDEIKRQGAYLETIFLNSPVAIITVDEHDHVMSWNPGAEQLFGYTKEEAIDRNMDELVAGTAETLSQARDYSQQARRHELHVITQRTRKDRSLVDVELSGVPLPLPTGESGLVAIYHDITELQRARQEAVAANEAKSAFLATMSHEIRTPMNAVIGMSGLLMDTPLNPEQRDYAETIRNSGDALLTIINDILDFSKIEAGKMELESQPFDLRECVESAMDLVATRANEKRLDLAYIIEDDVPAGVRGDVTRLRQILLNLGSNAVKFTEKGEVVLTVAPGTQPEQLLFSVRDSGIGIPKNRMGRLFASFSQADSSTTRKFGGTGLGLAISKRLAELMGGTMWAESEGAGKGSTFAFTIQAPAVRVTARKTVRELNGVQPSLNGKRVLIVDDNATNRRILMLQTGKWGMAPRETESPLEALRLLKSSAPIDLAILDVQMPEMDGVTLAGEVRKLKSREQLPLILLTSLGRRESGAEELDVAAFLTKPLKPSSLFDALAGIFGQHVAAPRVEASKAAIDADLAKGHPLRILLAEDNAVNQKLALRLLEQMGYRADVASNGIEAVESVERQAYDVVLMDVQMPEMDGLDATRAIRKLTSLRQPRVIAMTANAMQGDREMCLAAGMDDYVSKPIRVAELIEALRRAQGAAAKAAARQTGKPRAAPGRAAARKPRAGAAAKTALRSKPRRAVRSRKK